MPLAPGTQLGHYTVTAMIGRGGMGEVYRGRDTRLGRDVAIKVSADRFSERFEREARAIAALNHPNICTLYDVGPNYLVMEYIEGEAPKGPMSVDEALGIAAQIAAALREAHEKRITHRDLKPANIKIKADGLVKVLDFGLAKIGPAPVELSEDSPTLTMGGTVAGTILGTAAYMSPEQARGKDVDKRTDIWAFGVVLYELLTGARPFQGEDLGETLASVVKEPVDLTPIPARVKRLIGRCLEKDARKRLQDIGDYDTLLVEEPAPVVAAAPVVKRGWWPYAAGALAVALAGVGYAHFRETPPARELMRFDVEGSNVFAISPDGKTMAIRTGPTENNRLQIMLRSMETGQSRLLMDDALGRSFFWSPDSRSLAIGGGPSNNLVRVDIDSGRQQVLCPVPAFTGIDGTWTNDGLILFTGESGIHQVPARGGECKVALAVDKKQGEASATSPLMLPDGRHFLYSLSGQDTAQRGVYVGSLDAKPTEQGRQRLLTGLSFARFVTASESGAPNYLLFVQGQRALVQEFDLKALQLKGDAIPVAENVTGNRASVSKTGILAYQSTTQRLLQLTWLDRSGKPMGQLDEPTAGTGTPAISRDGAKVVFTKNQNFWLHDFKTVTTSRFTSTRSQMPIWSPDNSRVAFSNPRTVFQKPVNGSQEAQPLWDGQENATKFPMDWSKDGKYFLFVAAEAGQDIWITPLEPRAPPRALIATPAIEGHARLSPDGRVLAYDSNETGMTEVYARPFSAEGTVGAPVKISQGGGTQPIWRKSGGELYYIGPDGAAMAVEVTASPTLKRGATKELFRATDVLVLTGGGPAHLWDVAPDGRFLLPMAVGQATKPPPITVVLNWPELLKRQ